MTLRTGFRALIAFLIFSFSLTQSNATDDANIYLASGDKRVSLIELYTSEGCSSCPPADEWLSDFVNSDDLWTNIVPIAFHVDYWDYIGWKDRFAQPGFTTRQRDHAARLGMRTIYTPGVFFSGSEWQRWRREARDFASNETSGKLDAVVNTDSGAFAARYVASEADLATNSSFVLHTAILGFDIVTAVERGENGGRELNHDFVVLGYRETALKAVDGDVAIPQSLSSLERSNGDGSTSFVSEAELPAVSESAPRQAIAFWISHANSSAPLQATGGWISALN